MAEEKKLYVGNLPYTVRNEELKELFKSCGEVVYSEVILFKHSDRSKGFGFVEMANSEEAKAAVEEMNGKEIDGRAIVVNEARPKTERDERS